jgi:hypothetical protein
MLRDDGPAQRQMAPAGSDFDGGFVRDCIREVCFPPSTIRHSIANSDR